MVREDWRLKWSQGLSEPELKFVVCGEIGHVRWLLLIAAMREAARRDLDTLLREFADRVGVKYAPTQRRQQAPHNAHNAGQPGGNP